MICGLNYLRYSSMHTTIISGSHRNPSQSEKVGRYIKTLLTEQKNGVTPFLYTLADNPLPLWDQSIWENDKIWIDRLAPLKEQLSKSDAFIIITPEWHGQVPAGLKNFLLMFNRFEMGHKPALIVSVSSGMGGTYPVAELRMNSSKNNRLCYIPEHLIIRHVEQVLNADKEDNDKKSDSYYRERINWSVDILLAYASALKPMRENPLIHNEKFSNGM